MRKRFVLILCIQSALLLFLFSKLNAQVLNGSILLNTQAQVDAFNYTEVNGTIQVAGSSITNLNGLSELTKCNSLIITSNPVLINIIGLANLVSVKDDLAIINNGSLTTLVGFSSHF